MKKLLVLALLVATTAASAAAQSHVLVVSGLGGEPRYSDLFFMLGKGLVESMRTRHGVDAKSIVFLAEDPARDPAVVASRSTRENIEKELKRIASVARAGEHVVVVLIGHGSSQGTEGKFNIPGLDIGATDFGKLLDPLAAQRVAFVNLSSGSGDFIAALSAPNRVVITATKTGFERIDPHFPKYFVESFGKDVADQDKDGRVSLLEAFEYARLEVKRFYEEDARLLTEHAMLDDNGDKQGSHEPDPRSATVDGSGARGFFLAGRVAAGIAAKDPRLAQLLQDKAELESSIEALRRVKDTMAAEQYELQLEKLLLELAAKTKAINELGGGSP